jgi:hypothetical protein
MMSLVSKRELVEAVRQRYRASTRIDKGRILDEFVATTGYDRKYAIQLLNHPPKPRRTPLKRLKRRRYTPQVKDVLVKLWHIADGICGKRLVPALPDWVEALERHGELTLDECTRTLLLSISPATADRLLADERRVRIGRGRATTKPGTLLKHQIKVRTFADWDDDRPGFVEVDLVAHCDDSVAGHFLYTLVLTDIATAWTECVPIRNRSEKAVTAAVELARARFPFPLLGIDSDNGSEFINDELLRYCRDQHLTFTRCRPYKKNDQAHVEQKNWSIVRHFVGYDRFESRAALKALVELYGVLRLYANFFLPSLKLIDKRRVDTKVRKKYDTAMTPYRRVRASGILAPDVKEDLDALYAALNPAALKHRLDRFQDTLWQYATVRSAREAT